MALVVSFIGLRAKNLPSKALSRLTVLVFTVLVVGTAASAVALSREEAEHREEEQTEAKLEELEPGATSGESPEGQGEPAGGLEAPDPHGTSPAPRAPRPPPP